MNKIKRKINDFLGQLCVYCIVFTPIIAVMLYVKANFISEIITCVISFIIFTYIKIKIENKIRIKPMFHEKYYKDIPNIKPAILKFYTSKEKFYDDYYDFYATILDLINRRYLLLNFETKILTINKTANLNNLEKFELNIIELLFYKRNQTEIDFTKLKHELENDTLFWAKIEAWKNFVMMAANKNIYFDVDRKIDLLGKILGSIAGVIPFIFLILPSMFQINDIWCCVVWAIEIGGWCFATIDNKTYSKEMIEEIEKAKALARYIKDYSMLKEKDVNDIVLWDGYLVYSVILNTPDKIKKYFDDIFM